MRGVLQGASVDEDVWPRLAFYAQFGFETLPFDPRCAMVVRIADLERGGF